MEADRLAAVVLQHKDYVRVVLIQQGVVVVLQHMDWRLVGALVLQHKD